MKKLVTAVAVGGFVGLTIGVVAAFFHANVPTLVIRGVALTPSISAALTGGAVGLVAGLTLLRVRQSPKR